MSSSRRTCACCGAAGGRDYRLTIACALRAGVQLIAGAWHLHDVCAKRLVSQRRKVAT